MIGVSHCFYDVGDFIMNPIAEMIWLVLGGLLIALVYFLAGAVLCVTVVGITFGMQLFKLGAAVLNPFDKEVKPVHGGASGLAMVLNVIWLLTLGWGIALAHILGGILYSLTVVGIPIAKQHFKLAQVALLPFSYEVQ
jgi:uncharacterized membrane protein YccF (DUF307 family)